MKKLVIVLIAVYLSLPLTYASVDSIYEYLQRVDKGYEIVLGAQAKGGDSLAAIDVAIGIKKYNIKSPDLEAVIETDSSPAEDKIAIGHPCDNGLVPLSCESWPYRKGEAIISVIGGDLVIAGSTVDDTRRAAKIIGNYKAYNILKETLSVVVTEGGFGKINVTGMKSSQELICGDGVCESGERLCFSDCADMTCFDVCQEEGYDNAACRDAKSNPNVPSCLAEEYSKGEGYCATGKMCCCKKEQSTTEALEPEEKEKEQISLLRRILLFFKRLFTW